MVVPMWIEFIAARNGTSEAGSSSPVLEKCSNSSAKERKRCRSSKPRGSMSVDSVFLMTGIGRERLGGKDLEGKTWSERPGVGKTWRGKDLEARRQPAGRGMNRAEEFCKATNTWL